MAPSSRSAGTGCISTIAIREGFDFAAMRHGDGQYAPDELPNLVVRLRNGSADAAFGSRMMRPLNTRRGGMPLYKFVGNRQGSVSR